MADPERGRNARFKLLVHEDPDNDQLMLYVDYHSVHVRLMWRDSERQDVEDLMQHGTWFLERGHQEHLIQQGSSQIDTDLSSLFPDPDAFDKEEDEQ